ncbi:Transposase, GSU2180 family [hydrothermal vent metagenome]|uniref:Transposase, GSU2180 family n=1 Tax=hydrothermal vent metagenome TaxID=652676 RepID=A0A3B0T1Q6_9ZZZZ
MVVSITDLILAKFRAALSVLNCSDTCLCQQAGFLIDSTVISLFMFMFDWAKFRTAKGGIKTNTVLETVQELELPKDTDQNILKGWDYNPLWQESR